MRLTPLSPMSKVEPPSSPGQTRANVLGAFHNNIRACDVAWNAQSGRFTIKSRQVHSETLAHESGGTLERELFRRSCSQCHTKPEPKVAPAIAGQAGQVEVELRNLPYVACRCGRLARWAFDPGTDLSEQLFFSGVPFARSGPSCSRCGFKLGAHTSVELHAEARIDGFEPIEFLMRGPGWQCSACGLGQAVPGLFDAWPRPADGARALASAVERLGLPK
jgi:hypothetical protein